jgi:2-iminobutanoate/2-iminopropanoate deaminase
MTRKIKVDTGGKTWAPYSPGISVKDHIWLSGQIGVDSGDTIELQLKGVLKKIDRLLEAANSSKKDLVRVTILMTDIGNYKVINEIYGEWLEEIIPPSRAAYEVPNLPMGALVEIVCEAFRDLEN